MSRHTRLPLVLLLPLLSACIDFVEVSGPRRANRPATLSVNIRTSLGGGRSELEVVGLLHPGTDSGSRPRILANDTLWVMHHSLLPQLSMPDSSRHYLLRSNQGLDDSLAVRFPRIHGVSGELPLIRWYPPRRLDPDTIVLTQGSDLVLRVRTREAVSDPPAERIQWYLLLGSQHGQLRIDRTGAVPSSLVLPWSLLPATDGGTLLVVLRMLESHEYEAPARDYLLSSSLEIELSWTVRLTAAEDG